MIINPFAKIYKRVRKPKFPKRRRVIGSHKSDKNSKTLRFFDENKTRILKKAFLAFGLIFLALCILGIYSLASVYEALDFDNKTTWQDQPKLNILVLGLDKKPNNYAFVDAIAVLSINLNENNVGVFTLDPDILFTAENGDQESLRKAYNSLDEKPVDVLKYGVEETLAINIDKYIIVNEESFVNMQDLLGPVRLNFNEEFTEKDLDYTEEVNFKAGKNNYEGVDLLAALSTDEEGLDSKLQTQNEALKDILLNTNSLSNIVRVLKYLRQIEYIQTDFSKGEMFRLYRFFYGLTPGDVRVGYTQQSSLFQTSINGVESKRIMVDRVDKDVQSIFLDSGIVKEQARLEVLNGTGSSGLATKYSRLFENYGIRIVRAGNAINQSEKTILYVSDGNYPNTFREIEDTFPFDIEMLKEEYKYKHVGDIVLILGLDLEQDN